MNKICTLHVALVIVLLILTGCEGGETTTLASNPFLGGTEGLVAQFEPGSPPQETLDGGTAPFDILVKLENKGETLVTKDHVQVSITGIRPADFGATEADLTQNAPDDLTPTAIDQSGKTQEGIPTYVEFSGLNHKERIAGAMLSYTLKADVCYLYRTTAAAKLCVRENILTPQAGGLCDITGSKTVYNSGAPLQVANVEEQARAKDKIGFSFEVTHPGSGQFFEKGSLCDQSDRKLQKKAFVRVETKLPGLSCTGLTQSSEGVVEGSVQVLEGSRLISCAQQLSALRDYEMPVKIELTYDYLQSIQTNINVKTAGE